MTHLNRPMKTVNDLGIPIWTCCLQLIRVFSIFTPRNRVACCKSANDESSAAAAIQTMSVVSLFFFNWWLGNGLFRVKKMSQPQRIFMQMYSKEYKSWYNNIYIYLKILHNNIYCYILLYIYILRCLWGCSAAKCCFPLSSPQNFRYCRHAKNVMAVDTDRHNSDWLVVSTILKNINQLGRIIPYIYYEK